MCQINESLESKMNSIESELSINNHYIRRQADKASAIYTSTGKTSLPTTIIKSKKNQLDQESNKLRELKTTQ